MHNISQEKCARRIEKKKPFPVACMNPRTGCPSQRRVNVSCTNSLIRRLLIGISALILTVVPLSAQETLQNSSIFGTITDTSGAVLPGTGVVVTSPALQGKRTVTSDDQGSYRISDLPAGTYQITYSKTGFQTTVRSDLTLTAGFNARLDILLKVGQATQTVEVSGQAPVVDTSTSVTSTNLGRVTLDAVPTSRSIYQAVYLAPGVRPSSTPDVGGSQLGLQQHIGSYGYNGNLTLLIDGINGLQSNSINGYAAPGNFVDYDSLQEFRVISTGADADIGTAGPVIITIMKSGGNEFHGDAHFMYEPHWFQLTNLPDSVKGGSDSNQLQYFWDAFGDLGGKLIKDKLWFYGGLHLQRNSQAVFGYIGPDGKQGYNPGHQDNSEAKVTYQLTPNLKLIGDYTRATKVNPQYAGSPSIAYPSTYDYALPFWNAKGEVTWTHGTKWLIDVLGGKMWQAYFYGPNQPGTQVAGNPYTVNQTTGITTGAMFNVSSSDSGSHNRLQLHGSVSYFPNGKHSFQWGATAYVPQSDVKSAYNHEAGNYELLTEGTTTVMPYEINTFNFPFEAVGKQRAIGVYGKDVWRVTSQLTLNYGVRFDHNLVYNDEENEPVGPFSPGGSYPAQTVADWNRVTPRIGVAYDLTGSGKTVLRGSYGMYNIPALGAFDLSNYNPAGLLKTTYDWSGDTCQVTAHTECAPSDAFIASLVGPTSTFNGKNIYIGTTGGVNGIVNPKLRMPFFHTFTATLERALASDMALRVLYVGNFEEDEYDTTYPDRPMSSYTLQYNTVYPATDPVNGGKPITIDYYPASLKTASSTMFVNRDGHGDHFQTMELTFTKRGGNKWSALATLDLTKDHMWLPTTSPGVFKSGESAAQPPAPYQQLFPLDETWDWTFKSYFTYNLPYGIDAGVNYQWLAGAPSYATDQFSVPNIGTVYIPVEQFGTHRAPNLNVLNLRFAKVFPIKEHDRLELTLELFNALNASPGTTVNFINGTGTKAFGFTSEYMSPMVGRVGVKFSF